jgi:hypothetical protein
MRKQAVLCDRCGEEINRQHKQFETWLGWDLVSDGIGVKLFPDADLCFKCLKDWLILLVERWKREDTQ